MTTPNILAIIPARGGTKGIPRKNIKKLNGKPLLEYTVNSVSKSHFINKAILTTDDLEIASVAEELGLDIPFIRPNELSADDSPMLPVLIHAVKYMEEHECFSPDYIILLQPTSPFRARKHIDESIEKLINSDADSIVSVVQVPHAFNPYSVMEEKNGILTPYLAYDERDNSRQKKPVFYGRNGAAIYAFTRECLMKKNSIFGDKILPYHMEEKSSLDLDSEWDWLLAEAILKNDLLSKI